MNIVKSKRPLLHIFGHAHSDGGRTTTEGPTTLINAALAQGHSKIVRQPMMVQVWVPTH